MFNGAVEYDTELAEAARKSQEEENSSSDFKRRARVKCREGLNVYLWLPSFDNRKEKNPEPLRFVPVHFNPFHVCGRGDAVVSTDDSDKLSEDRRFQHCPRCQKAWDYRVEAMEELGLDKESVKSHPVGKKCSSDMPQMRSALQVVELTGFFKPDASKAFAQLDMKKVEAYWTQFLHVISTGELPEGCDMPEEMVEAAQAGVDILLMNKEAGTALYKKHLTKSVENGKSPLFSPDKFMLTIKRGESKDNQFQGRDGKTRFKGVYTPEFSPMAQTSKAWAKMCQELVDALNTRENFEWINIYDPAVTLEGSETEEEVLKALAAGMVRMDHDQIEKYLELTKHTYSWKEELAKDKEKAESAPVSKAEQSIEEEPVVNFNKFSSPDDSDEEEDLQAELAAFRASAAKMTSHTEDSDD